MNDSLVSKVASTVVAICLLPSGLASPSAATVAMDRAGRALWVWPLDPVPRVVRYFEPPDSPYGAGHRGIDLAGSLGWPVLAIGAGTVTFAGTIAGRGVVVVDHGALRSTYEPVLPGVSVGASVAAGQPIGTLELVHSHCLPDVCLHLGVRRGDAYLDPLPLLGPRPVHLKPLEGDGSARPAPPLPPRSPPPGGRGGRGKHYARGWAC